MSQSAQQIADNASFQAFMNCYLREVDSGVWHSARHWSCLSGQDFDQQEAQVIELQLPYQELTLAVGVAYRSLVGRHSFTRLYQQKNHQLGWHSLDYFATLILLVNEIYSGIQQKHNDSDNHASNHSSLNQRSPNQLSQNPAATENQTATRQDKLKTMQLELLARLIESQQVMTRYLATRSEDKALNSIRFIDSEQSLLFGHWLHPTPKSRQGFHDWQHREYAPEMCGQFKLHYFAVDRSLVKQRSILEQNAEALILEQLKDSAPTLDRQQVLIPIHPLQAQWLLHQDYIIKLMDNKQLFNLGPLGPVYTATSSVRTVYSQDSDYMFKFSIPVKITNSLRINMHHELEAGLVVASLFRLTGFSERYPTFQIISDPAYISLSLPDRKETGFEVILRENPFKGSGSDRESKDTTVNMNGERSIHSIAAITQCPLDNNTLSRLARVIRQLAQEEQRAIEEVSLDWFDRYWACAIEPAIRLYDEHGIALEAHQQNSLLDITEGYPCRYYFRDNQGFYLSESHRQSLVALEPEAMKTEGLFYQDEMIFDRFTYYLVVNQLFSLINRFGIDGLISEHQLLSTTNQKLQSLKSDLKGLGIELINTILKRREIPCKGNLLTRIEDRDELQAEHELAVYTRIKNPLPGFSQIAETNPPKPVAQEIRLESA